MLAVVTVELRTLSLKWMLREMRLRELTMCHITEFKGWSKIEKKMLNIPRPFSVKLYNQHIGGVDLIDQCVAMYPHRRRNKRWYIRVLFHFLDMTNVNAWHLYRMSGLEQKDLLHF